jgi:hypothetical protein
MDGVLSRGQYNDGCLVVGVMEYATWDKSLGLVTILVMEQPRVRRLATILAKS